MPYNYQNSYQSYYPQYVQPQIQTQQNQQNQTVQNGGLVTVRSEDEAKGYPVALGTSVTFIDENNPMVYTKTMGFSQLDRPIFKKYRLVEEPENNLNSQPTKTSSEKEKGEIEAIWSEIEHIKKDIKGLSHRRKEVKTNEQHT